MPLWLFKCFLYCILAGHTKYKLGKMRHHTLSINYHNIKKFYSFAFWAEQWQIVKQQNFKECLQNFPYLECELYTCSLASDFIWILLIRATLGLNEAKKKWLGHYIVDQMNLFKSSETEDIGVKNISSFSSQRMQEAS